MTVSMHNSFHRGAAEKKNKVFKLLLLACSDAVELAGALIKE